MTKEPVIHYAPVQYRFAGGYHGTGCGRVVARELTVTDLRDATCRVCLNQVTKQAKSEMCSGCEDDFYNGNNALGVKQCWHLSEAKVVRKKRVHIDDAPPWKLQPVVTVLSCRRQKGYVFMSPERVDWS